MSKILHSEKHGDIVVPDEVYDWWIAEIVRCQKADNIPDLTLDTLLDRVEMLEKSGVDFSTDGGVKKLAYIQRKLRQAEND